MGEVEYVCDKCYYFVDGPRWDESVCTECWRMPGLKDNFKPRPSVSPSTEGYDGWMEKEVEKR